MDQRQQNRLSMMKAVQATNLAHKSAWVNMKPFKKVNDELDSLIATLDKAAEGQQANSTGVTEDKESLAETAVKMVLGIANNASAYALETKDNTLFAKLDVSKFRLLTLPDNEQAAALNAILSAVEPIVVKLADYNITAAVMKNAHDAVNASNGALSNPRMVINSRSTATASVPVLLRDGKGILARMDRMIHNFEDADAAYVSNYKGARNTIDVGSRSENKGKGVTPLPANGTVKV